MDFEVLLLGPVGAGKTQAIRAVSDIETVETEALATDEVADRKTQTTVSMDMGVMRLDGEDRLILYGAPGQQRFDFMWDILLERAKALILLIDHADPNSVKVFERYLEEARKRTALRPLPLMVGLSHVDRAPTRPTSLYIDYLQQQAPECQCEWCRPPVVTTDPRSASDVRRLLLACTAMLEMCGRFPSKGCRR